MTTTLKGDLHELAQKKGISWTDALEMGVRKLLSFRGERRLIQQEIELLQERIMKLQDRLNAIDRLEEEMGDIEVVTLEVVLEKFKKIIDRGNLVTREMIEYNAPKIGLLPEELEQIVKNRLGVDVIDNTREAKRSKFIYGLDGGLP